MVKPGLLEKARNQMHSQIIWNDSGEVGFKGMFLF